MVKEMKDKVAKTYSTARKMEKHFEEILDAVALTSLVGFAGYQSYIHRNDGIAWILLGIAAGYAVLQAFRAWYRALNK